MNKKGNMQDRIGVEMVDLDAVAVQQSVEEVKAALHKLLKQNNFI